MPEPTGLPEPTDLPEPPSLPETSSIPAPPSAPLPAHPTGEVFVEADDDDREPEDETVRTSALRTATVVSARVVLGLVVIAAIAAVVAAASLLPLPSIHSSAPSTLVSPVPTTQQLVCPGSLLRLASASGKGANTVSSLGVPAIERGATMGGVTEKPFTSSDAGTSGTRRAPQLLSTEAAASGGATHTLLAGAESESIATDEFAGLASAGCTGPTGDVWLAGGATSVGRTTLLLLANPSAVAANVSLEIYGENGEVTAPGMDGIGVVAGGQRVLSLAGFAPGLVSPVVHVESEGGQVVASLEQSTVRGLQPGGIDFVGGEAAPTQTTVIPGVVLAGTEAVQSQLGQSGFDDLQTTIRFFVPGAKPAVATVSVIAENGAPTGKAIRADLSAKTVTDLPLDELSDGSYTLVITSTAPIISSVRVSTAGSAAVGATTDFAWMTAAPLLTGDTLVSIPSGMTPVVHLENPTDSPETVTLSALGGGDIAAAVLHATVAARSATSVAVGPGISYRISGFSQLYASVSGVTDGGVTGYVVIPSALGETPLRIYG